MVKTLTLPRMMLIVGLGLFLAACQTTPPTPTLPLTSAPGITQGGFPEGIGPANSNGGPAGPGAAALNKRLLRQMA